MPTTQAQPASSSGSYLVRPAVAGVVSALLENKLMGEKNMTKNGQFGLAVGAGVALADSIAASLPVMPGLGTTASGKEVSTRLTEVVLGTSSAFVLNRYVLGSYGSEYSTFAQDLGQRFAIVAAADVVSNVILDVIHAKPMSLYA